MINIKLMSKLYLVVAYNLNEAKESRDSHRKRKTTPNTEQLRVGDNVLVRDHISKAFQPKYKDFCIKGNQRQPWTYNKTALKGREKDTKDRES